MELIKNEEYTLPIDGYTAEGAGVGRIGGFPVFVENTVRGDVIRVRIVKPGKRFAYGKCMEILHPSEARCEPICPHFYACGGCSLWHMNAEERRYFKKNKVENAFLHIAGLSVPVADTETAEDVGYRNKTQMPIAPDYTQAMYKNRTNTKVSVPHCVIEDDRCREVTTILLDELKRQGIPPYDPETGTGVARHIYTRVSEETGKVLAVLVATKKLELSSVIPRLKDKAAGLIVNINTAKTNKILGEKNIRIFGEDHITDRLCGTRFDIYPDSFFQVNRFLTERLYNKAVKLAHLTGKETVFDLYCGAGTITAALAAHAGRVIGVEIVPSAVKSAKESLRRAGIENAEIYEGEAEKVAPRLIKEGARADVVVVDPPRKGCGEELLAAIRTMAPERIVYVSCDPATLARDVKILSPDYTVVGAYPYDMFPGTSHVETVVLLSKLKSSEHIYVDINLDELDLTKAEKKATYDEIKEYVLKNHGLNVSQLNIAQVKRKYGIIERENYNKPKSDNSKQPNCTKEKEDAITDALKHFGMI